MKNTKIAGNLGLLALALASTQAMAQSPHGWYGGFSVGRSTAELDDGRTVAGIATNRLSTSTLRGEDRDTGYKVFFGKPFSRYLAIEGGLFDLGEFGFNATTLPLGTISGDTQVRGINLDLVASFPFTDHLSAFARAGVIHAESKSSFRSTGLVGLRRTGGTERDTNYKAGLGLQYAFSPRLALRGEVERYRITDAIGSKGDIDLASIGLVYRFGAPVVPVRRVSAPEPVAPAPTYVAPQPVTPPPPPPRVAPPPPPPAPAPRTKVSFEADALFDFDKGTLKPAGKQALDKFAADLRGTSIDSIVVTGHTDRLGASAYNQKLSERRAEVVRAYLVESASIPAGVIRTVGAGETQPETKPGQCKGDKATPALVACLQPDRRVEVEVTGTR